MSGVEQEGSTELLEWSQWQPQIVATLCFLQRGDEVLLIEKLTGFGAGKVNGPGGKLDPGETPAAGAVRELEEEIHVRPRQPQSRGELRFQFADGLSMLVHVFVATEWDGEPSPSREAKPFWTQIGSIPFERMWEDDRYWLPHALAGSVVDARFTFDGDRMTGRQVALRPAADAVTEA
jgi:8-oxo-dGTP diphosphatase